MYSPNFQITNRMLKSIGIIEGARQVILNAPLLPAWEAKFREEAVIRTVHHGTHLEGNELNYSEAARVIGGAEVVGRERDIQEVMNYREVLDFLEKFHSRNVKFADGDLSGINNIIDEALIKQIHALTMAKIMDLQNCGQYRLTQVVVKNSQTGEITFRPPPALELPYLMKEFSDWLTNLKNDDIHTVLKAGISQYELVRIHPFMDGNGRVGRALAMLVLYLENYDIKRFFSLEEYYDRNPQRYYSALQSVDLSSEKYDLTLWLEYFSEGLAAELNRVKEKVLRLSADMHLKQKLGGKQVFLTGRQIKIVEYIQKVGFLQNKVFFELFPMVSEDTILRDLKFLLDKGIIKKIGVTKAARYVLK